MKNKQSAGRQIKDKKKERGKKTHAAKYDAVTEGQINKKSRQRETETNKEQAGGTKDESV